MHKGQLTINVDIVRRLLTTQFPELADLPIRPAPTTGTVNAIYRLGDHLYARLPRLPRWAADLEKEWLWLPRLAPKLTLRIPEPLYLGEPASCYPLRWAIYRWLGGQPYADQRIDDEREAARLLAGFVAELRSMKPQADAPRAGRRPLRQLDELTRQAIKAAGDGIAGDAAVSAWERALEAPAWSGKPVWIHTDLLRPNLLVDAGRLCAVLDFGGLGVGDPAADVIPAWTVLGAEGREVFRSTLGVDDATWNRARGFALHQAALIIPYYEQTNPRFAALAKRTVKQIVTDLFGDPR